VTVTVFVGSAVLLMMAVFRGETEAKRAAPVRLIFMLEIIYNECGVFKRM
jgi:hypothetical protein